MQNNNFQSEEFINNTGSEVFQIFMGLGLELGNPDHREAASCVLVKLQHSLLLLAGSRHISYQALEDHFMDYKIKMSALAIPEAELREAGLLPKSSGVN
jgi:hypothetical protein